MGPSAADSKKQREYPGERAGYRPLFLRFRKTSETFYEQKEHSEEVRRQKEERREDEHASPFSLPPSASRLLPMSSIAIIAGALRSHSGHLRLTFLMTNHVR